MCDFNRFDKIFGLDNTKKQTPVSKRKRNLLKTETSKRKQPLQEKESPFVLDLSITKKLRNETIVNSPLERIKSPARKFNSPDKKPILEHLSCDIEEFVQEPCDGNDTDTTVDDFQMQQDEGVAAEVAATQKLEIYSPEIEEYSEGDDIFNMSQEGEQIISINIGISETYQKKPRYKPKNKISKPGGMMEKLRAIQNKRLSDGRKYAKTDEGFKTNQRKIEILESCNFRRRLLLLRFKFYDDFNPPNFEQDEHFHFLAVPPDFANFISKHSFYDVVFDLPKQQFMPNHFVHFAKLIRAGRKY